jgi:hypothetical protein
MLHGFAPFIVGRAADILVVQHLSEYIRRAYSEGDCR